MRMKNILRMLQFIFVAIVIIFIIVSFFTKDIKPLQPLTQQESINKTDADTFNFSK